MDTSDLEPIKKQFDTVMKIAYAATSSIFIYGFIAYWIVKSNSVETAPHAKAELIRAALLMVSFFSLASIRAIRSRILNTNHFRELSTQQILEKLTMWTMIVLGICETPGLLGLITTLFSRNMNDFYIFAIIGAGAFAINFPKYEQWERIVLEYSSINR